jgi:eukaryotic-like serine/threonine-protein kinase
MTLGPGTQLGPYEIVAPLGAGGMGEVYRARDSRLRREVAVKVLPKAFSADADRLHRFEQEALATAALNHPNILAVFDIGDSEGSPYVVSELLEGETLRDRLRTGPIPIRKALDYALQIAHGLAAAHEKGIIHRDLKPENLFITKDGRVKILDFGLAKLTQSDPNTHTSLATASHGTEAGVVLGTAGYMSPEQVRGQPLDARSDIFSFGAILYEMLSGKRAFHGSTPADTMSSILKEEPEDLSATNRNISPALERIVHHCLEKNPEARFHSASDIAFDLEHLSGTSAASARVAPLQAASAPRKSLAAIAALAAPLVAVLAGWWIDHARSHRPPPQYKQITFRTGVVGNARFAPDGTIVYSASWDGGEKQLYASRENEPNSRELGLKGAEVLSISSTGELAIRLNSRNDRGGGWIQYGTLARVPLGGGTPREMLDNVMDADWSPKGDSLAVARFLPETGHWHLEYPIGKVLLDTINWISAPKISPDGRWIAFVDHENNTGDDEGSIAAISTDGKGEEKKLSTNWEAIEGLFWSPSGDEIWFTAAPSGSATNPHAVTLSGKLRTIANVPGGMWFQDQRNAAVLVTTFVARFGLRARAPGSTQERELGWFGLSVMGDLSRDGKKVLFFDGSEAGGPNYTVFLRDTDGSPPANLGEGMALSVSPDAKWVVVKPPKGGPLSLVPTGAGETRVLTHDSRNYTDVSWLPDGKHLLVSGIEAGHGKRDYLIDVSSGDSKPLTPEGVWGVALSPDGKTAAVRGPDGNWGTWQLENGGGFQLIPGATSKYVIKGWLPDGKSLYAVSQLASASLMSQPVSVAKVYKVDVATAQIEYWKSFGDPTAGYVFVDAPLFSADGNSYVYRYGYFTSQAYEVTGLQ